MKHYTLSICLISVIIISEISCNNALKNNNAAILPASDLAMKEGGSAIGKIYTYSPESGLSDFPLLKGYKLVSSGQYDNYGRGISLFQKGSDDLLLFDSCIMVRDRVIGCKIIDTLFVPGVGDEKELDYAFCTYNITMRSDVIGLFKSQKNRAFLTNPIKAWRIDSVTRRIIPIDTAHIRVYQIDSTEAD